MWIGFMFLENCCLLCLFDVPMEESQATAPGGDVGQVRQFNKKCMPGEYEQDRLGLKLTPDMKNVLRECWKGTEIQHEVYSESFLGTFSL